MTSQTRATLKGYFNTNDQPTEAQFADLIDSAVNVADTSPGVGTDGYGLVWDNATSTFVLRAPFAGLLATGATVGATAQAQAFTNGLTAGGTYDGTISAVRGLQLINPTDQYFYNYLRSGATVDQKVYFAWADYAGVTKWYFGKDQVNDIILFDTLSAVHRLTVGINDATIIDSAGANAVIVNGCGNANSGTGGLIVKSGTTERATYGSITNVGLTINGVVEMQATTSATTGVITKESDRFIHNFKHPSGGTALPIGENAFFGIRSGNFTTGATATATYHASHNLGVGDWTLSVLTTGYNNTGVGVRSLLAVTTGRGNVGLGTYALTACTEGQDNLGIGYQALGSLTDGYSSVAIGASAGYSQTSGGANVFIGNYAGYYETGSNKLFIDNDIRASEADGRSKALIYGVFNAAVASQSLTFNAGSMGFFGHAAAAQPTKAGHNNWAALSDVVAALVSIGILDTA